MKTVKMSLANLQGKMSRKEMKNIMAGSGNLALCVANTNWRSGGPYACFANSDAAYSYAGDNGYWCCNCQTAYNHCWGMGT
ncbi:MAG: hypothetical protein ACK5KP_01455 [Paludibacteraceae bacterium]